jgi:hypothetical protein
MAVLLRDEFKKAVDKISEYLQEFTGSRPTFMDTSTADSLFSNTTIAFRGIATQIIVCQPRNQTRVDIIFSSGTVKLPQENLVAFFRQLLTWNMLQTDIAHFGLNDDQGIVSLVYRRPFEGFDYNEFKFALESISNINNNCIAILRSTFAV